jgi:hypothetical protein
VDDIVTVTSRRVWGWISNRFSLELAYIKRGRKNVPLVQPRPAETAHPSDSETMATNAFHPRDNVVSPAGTNLEHSTLQ